jgi:hypothetical protein
MTKKIVKKPVSSMKLTEKEIRNLLTDGNIDDAIEFLKFVKLQSKKHVIGPGWVGIDVLPHNDSVIVNKLWDEKMETEKKKKL